MPGYEYTFVSEVSPEYCCPICECPMREPVQTKCGHRFCKECLEKSLKRKRKCPIDRRSIDERNPKDIYPDVAIKRNILDFIVKCPNESNGCKWTDELRNVETHQATCDFIGVQCTNKDCKVAPLKKDLLKHVTSECPMRKVKCQHCKTSIVWRLKQDHFDSCKKYPMTCLQKCGEHKISRDEMNDHIEKSCPNTKVDCTFAHIGCKVKVQRRAIADHAKTSTESHLKLACEKLAEFQALSTVNRGTVKELEAQMVISNKKITKLSQVVVELRDKISLADEKLTELQTQDEAQESPHHEFSDEKLLELHDAVNELQKLVPKYKRLQNLPAEFTGIKNKLQNLEAAVSKLRQGKCDSHEASALWNEVTLITIELGKLQDETHRDRSLLEDVRGQFSALRENSRKYGLIDIIIMVFFVWGLLTGIPNKEPKDLASNTTQPAYLTEMNGSVHFLHDENKCKTTKFVWSISQFDLRFRKARAGSSKPCFSSETFFSEPYGYRMAITMCPNGFDASQNYYLSLFAHIVRSNNDDILPWPFQQTVVFTLIDQQEESSQMKNVEMQMSPKEMRHLFRSIQKVKQSRYRNEGFGFAYFVSHSKLRSRKYIRHDTVLVQFEVYPLDCP
ncbi:TNF receptor-associated factor 5-like [Montipora capricornis]|uniref:TNF receptor-associated factor 5-like n=1 Tax=Montipora capricornis TaxID=246305 RepID=UPI0035F1B938